MLSYVRHYFLDESYMFQRCTDGIYRRCILVEEIVDIVYHYHTSSYGIHVNSSKTTFKVLWILLAHYFKDARNFVLACDKCQSVGNV